MGRCALEVADVFRVHGPAWRQAECGHLSLGQQKVMSAIEQCRSAALGGHVLHCNACEHSEIAYNSCRNRHCPKCQASAARRWREARQADLLPVDYYHVVFTLPAPISTIAYTNKAVIYGLLFEVAAETLRTLAADPKHLGAHIGVTLVLHTWGSALTHHPHVLPGGFHRIRHYGLLANSGRRDHLAKVRELLHVVAGADSPAADAPTGIAQPTFVCPDCGAAMIVVEILIRGQPIRAPPPFRGAP